MFFNLGGLTNILLHISELYGIDLYFFIISSLANFKFSGIFFTVSWSYDKIFSVNTIYFWRSPASTISKAINLLKANGMMVLGFHSKDEMERMDLDENIFQLYTLQDVRNLLKTDKILKEVERFTSKPGSISYLIK